MFKRPLKVKSHSSVKKSERKHLLEAICIVHNGLKPDDLRKSIFPDGEDILCLKIETLPGLPAEPSPGPTKPAPNAPTSFHIYCDAKKQPFFAAYDIVISRIPKTTFLTTYMPTVYAVWQLPSLVPLSFVTHGEVVVKLQKGAKLMLAGATPTNSCLEALQSCVFRKNEAYATVVLSGADSVVGVGRILMDSDDLKQRLAGEGERRGELLEMVHLVDDELWALGDKSTAEDYRQNSQLVTKATEPSLLTEENNSSENVTSAADNLPEAPIPGVSSEVDRGGDSTDVQGDPDIVFQKIFLTTLKSRVIETSLPMLASTLNKHLLEISRRISDPPLEIKNTSYRKLGKFLEEMQSSGLITLMKIKEGVEAIAAVDWKNTRFKDIEVIPADPVEAADKALRMPTAVRQVYIVNGKVAPLFQNVHQEMGKGFEFRSTDAVRDVVSQYIKSHNLASPADKTVINLDKLLVDLLLTKSMKFEGNWPMKWGEVFDKILKEMSVNHEVVFTNGTSSELKGKFVPLEVKVEKKAGNKLVTVVRHFEGLGMDPLAISRDLQQIVGATVGVREEGGPNNITSCVTIQGDQTKLLHKYFFQTHSVPTKFVTGLEKASKKS
ncbi:eukaryotic translation initiation factor 2D-like [Paramacrobiotus metropolitanus]|uniref:eukaryotic translation initiation factor 2D-like n=1 Tax=Paramacrobiotus metropolitanus TaxID=2943436 RepID=UPI002445B840|nr:eukaryotic translation initiation factor 2D-like [Paramacrobiotus metropolitanus]